MFKGRIKDYIKRKKKKKLKRDYINRLYMGFSQNRDRIKDFFWLISNSNRQIKQKEKKSGSERI